ncbi:MAG TPA: hypothetical protein P5077_12940 [bacterium]|nr:hypothetical protein [bacterium]
MATYPITTRGYAAIKKELLVSFVLAVAAIIIVSSGRDEKAR